MPDILTVLFVPDFLKNLPKVKSDELPPERESCMICQEQYGTVTNDGILEHPVRLPCGHVLGNDCIEKWLYDNDQNTCPYCRKELFPSTLLESEDEEYKEEEDNDDDDDYDTYYMHDAEYIRVAIEGIVEEPERIQALSTAAIRECELYLRLSRARAQLPPLKTELGGRAGGGGLFHACAQALTEEIKRRGGLTSFSYANLRCGGLLRTIYAENGGSEWPLWETLRENTYVWRPRMFRAGRLVPSGWSIADGVEVELEGFDFEGEMELELELELEPELEPELAGPAQRMLWSTECIW